MGDFLQLLIIAIVVIAGVIQEQRKKARIKKQIEEEGQGRRSSETASPPATSQETAAGEEEVEEVEDLEGQRQIQLKKQLLAKFAVLSQKPPPLPRKGPVPISTKEYVKLSQRETRSASAAMDSACQLGDAKRPMRLAAFLPKDELARMMVLSEILQPPVSERVHHR